MSERAPGSSDRSFNRREVVSGLVALFAASTAPSLSAWASRELGDLAPDELLVRIQMELKPGGSMRNWLEEKDGKRTTREIVRFLKSLLPLVEELEKAVWGKSPYAAFKELILDPAKVPHIYQIELNKPPDAGKKWGEVVMGNGSIQMYRDRTYFITAWHVIEGTTVEDKFSVLTGETMSDISAVQVDFAGSQDYLRSLQNPSSGSFAQVMRVPITAPADRGGNIIYFLSEMHDEFDCTPRLCIPMTKAVASAFVELTREQAHLVSTTSREKMRDEVLQRYDSVAIGPAEFAKKLPNGHLEAQGRSGGVTLMRDDASAMWNSDGTFIAVGHQGATVLNGRSLLLTNRMQDLQNLLGAMHAHPRDPIVLDGKNGILLRAPSRWQTTIVHTENKKSIE